MVVPALADMMAQKILAIIGCGNPNRSDDGVGPDVVARLRARPLPDIVRLYDAGTDGMSVMYRARGASHLIIIDARAPEGAPGAIYDVPGDILAAPPPSSLNLHDFRWDHALFAGRRIYGSDFPGKIKVLLVEAQSLSLGLGLTPAVARAAEKVCADIEGMAGAFVSGRWA